MNYYTLIVLGVLESLCYGLHIMIVNGFFGMRSARIHVSLLDTNCVYCNGIRHVNYVLMEMIQMALT